MYLLILILVFGNAQGSFPFWPVAAIVYFGFAFSMYFTLLQAFVIKAFCTWCVVSAVEFTLMALSVFFLS